MSRNISRAVDRDMLFQKSSSYIRRALESKKADDIGMHWLLASVALELLGKAVLADRHPLLVVNHRDAESYDAIFVEAGTRPAAEVRTITAKMAYEKLEEIVPRFDREIMSFCNDMAARRNAELHSGESPFESADMDGWDERYWRACDAVLKHVGSSKERWMKADKISTSPAFYEEINVATAMKAVLRVDEAKMNFASGKRADQEQLSVDGNVGFQSASRMLKEKYDEIWNCDCPACGNMGLAAGNLAENLEAEENRYSVQGLDDLVTRNFIAEEFICPACGFELTSGEEVYYAARSGYHYEKYEKK